MAAVLLGLTAFGGYRGYRFLQTEYYLRAAEKAHEQHDFGQARRYASAALAASADSVRAHFLLARIARRADFYEEAEKQLDSCQRLEGATDQVALERVLLQVQQGALSLRTEAQLRLYLKQDHPESDQILEALSRGCLAAYRLDSALAYLNEWLERRPDNAQAYLWRGTVHERLLDFASAVHDCRQAVALAAQSREAQLRLAQALLQAGEVQEAAAFYEALRQQGPEQPLVTIGLAQCCAKLNRMSEAEKLLDELVASHPTEAPVLLERGRLALQNGQAAAAERWLHQAATLAPSDYQANYSWFLCLKQQGREAEAGQVWEKVRRLEADGARFRELTGRLRQHPYDLSLHCELARLFLGEGQDNEGVRWLKTALKIDPTYKLANQLLADYYESSGQPALALPYRQRAEAPAGASPLGPPGEGSP